MKYNFRKVSSYLSTKKELRIYTKLVDIIKEENATRADLDDVRRAIEVIMFAPYEVGEEFDELYGAEEIEREDW